MFKALKSLVHKLEKKNYLVLAYLVLILECVTPIVAISLQRDLINIVFIDKDYDQFVALIALYAAFFFLPKVFFSMRRVMFFEMSYRLSTRLIKDFLTKVYALSHKNVSKEHIGKLMHYIRHDIQDVSNLSMNVLLSELIRIILSVFLLAVMIAFINLKLLLFVSVITVLYYMLIKSFSKKMTSHQETCRKAKSNVSVCIEESVASMREVLAFGQEEDQIIKYEGTFKIYYGAVLKQTLHKIKSICMSDPFIYGTKVIVILTASKSILADAITLGEFVVAFTLVNDYVSTLGQLLEKAVVSKKFLAAVESLSTIMKAEEDEVGEEKLEAIKSITFENVSFAFDKKKAVLKDVSIEIPIGKKIAVVGESGSGKSTIAHLLLRLCEPSSGTILINSLPIKAYDESYKNHLSIVFQEPHFMPFSIKENLLLGSDYKKEKIENICRLIHSPFCLPSATSTLIYIFSLYIGWASYRK